MMPEKRYGVTLVELLIASVLMLGISLAAWGIYNSSQRFSLSATRQTAAKDEAAIALQHITRNVMVGNAINLLSPTQIRVRIDRNNTPGDFTDDLWLAYDYDSTSFELSYIPDINNPAESEVIARNISSLNFILSGSLLSIDITAEDKDETTTLNSAVMLRSMSSAE